MSKWYLRSVWFCNMHNHARFLRERRPCSVPEVGMTDVFFGDLELIPGEVLNAVNEACEKNIVRVPMQAGDVLLCDNYRVLHGRDVFEGDRLHAVSWFGDLKIIEQLTGDYGGVGEYVDVALFCFYCELRCHIYSCPLSVIVGVPV